MAGINMTKKEQEDVDDQLRSIQVHVFGPDQAVLTFTVYVDMPMSNLMLAYCQRTNLSMKALRFRLDGNTFNETNTAASLDMQDGAEIEVFHDGGQPSPLKLPQSVQSGTSNELSKMQKILVRQRGPENTVSQYIIKQNTPLRRLTHAYCKRMSISGRPKSSIHVKVIVPNYIETQFKINLNMPMRKMMHAFCDLTSQSMNAVQFLLDGQQLAENDTAMSLELKEGAMIEVWLSSWADF